MHLDNEKLKRFFAEILDATLVHGTTVKIDVSDFRNDTAIEVCYGGEGLWHIVQLSESFKNFDSLSS